MREEQFYDPIGKWFIEERVANGISILKDT